MRTRGFVIAAAAAALLLSGCAGARAASPTAVIESTPTDGPTPSDTATLAPAGPALVDPAAYPLPAGELADGMQGVMFTSGGDGLQCAIFDPLATFDTFATPPEFGCVVSVAGYPYPPAAGGPLDSYNAFLSWSHETAVATSVTDSTFSGDSQAPALPAGSDIAWSTVTCSALADDEVRCVDASSGHGMRVSVRDYELF